MKLKQIHRGLVLAAVASSFMLGCELIVDFDRTKIPVETTDSGTSNDASTATDTGTDASDASVVDGSDASDASDDASDAADQ